MYDAPGVGLAAPQVGLSLQLAVIEDREEYHKEVAEEQLRERERRPVPFHVIINPKITAIGGEQAEFFRGMPECVRIFGRGSAGAHRARGMLERARRTNRDRCVGVVRANPPA